MDGFPKARTANIVVSEYKDEFLIYDLKTHKCHSLNSTAYAVWKNADGEKTINEISLEVDRPSRKQIREKLVLLALSELDKRNLLEPGDVVNYGRVERREMIKKIGAVSMIALPIIMSITAPTASMAQSMNCATAPFSPGCVVSTCSGVGPPATVQSQCQTAFCVPNGAPMCASGNASTPACVPHATNPGQINCDCICD